MRRSVATYYILLTTSLLLTACGSDNGTTVVAPVEYGPDFINADELPVTYSVNAEAVTRSESESLDGDFKVCSWYYGEDTPETLWLGTSSGTTVTGESVSKKADGKWHAEETKLWPKGWTLNVDFYATHPVTAPNFTITTDNSDPENPYTYKGVSMTVGQDNATVTDLRYAYTPMTKAAARANDGTVALNFKHALSQVSFYGITENDDWHVAVQSISLHNVYSTGSFDLKKGEWNAASLGTLATYNLTMNSESPITFGYGDEAKALTKTDSPRLVLGQALTAWDTDNTIADNDAAAGPKDCYLAIKCHIWQGSGDDIEELFALNAGGTYKTAYIPFSPGTASGSWAPDEHYTYTLKFGGGFNEEGEPNLNQLITLTTTITPWTVVDAGSVNAD